MESTKISEAFLTTMREIARLGQEAGHFVSLNNSSPILMLHGKIVWQDGDKIFRLQSPNFVKKRLAVIELAKTSGAGELFLEEHIVEQNDLYILTAQEKIELLPKAWMYKQLSKNLDEKFQIDYYGEGRHIGYQAYLDYGRESFEAIKAFCFKNQIGGFRMENVGFDANKKIKVFDFIDNCAYNEVEDKLICPTSAT